VLCYGVGNEQSTDLAGADVQAVEGRGVYDGVVVVLLWFLKNLAEL